MKKKAGWLFFYAIIVLGMLQAVYWFGEAVTVLAENAPIKRMHRIVIDAGHGGVDGGATSCTGRLESGYNLEVAIRLNDLFRLMGYETRMVRTTDASVYTEGATIAQKKISDLKERVRITKESPGSLLVSIHQNHFPDNRYHGAVVLYADTPDSKELAEKLQKMILETINPGSKRQSKLADGIYLMEHIQCTGILVECGFLSNPEEEAKLASPDYQKKLCCVIAAAVSEYLAVNKV